MEFSRAVIPLFEKSQANSMKRLDSPFLIKDISTCQLCTGFWALEPLLLDFALYVLSHVQLFLQPSIDCSPPGSFVHGICRQECSSWLPLGYHPCLRIELVSVVSLALAARLFTPAPPKATLPRHTPPSNWILNYFHTVTALDGLSLISFLYTFPTIDIFFPCYKWNIL